MFKDFLHTGACFKGLTRITFKGIALAREYLIYEWFSGFPIRYPIRYPISIQLVSNYEPNQPRIKWHESTRHAAEIIENRFENHCCAAGVPENHSRKLLQHP